MAAHVIKNVSLFEVSYIMETFAPTASLAAYRLLVATSIFFFNGWSLRNLDIITTFNGHTEILLHGSIDIEAPRKCVILLYMGVPEGMDLRSKELHFVNP
jgi:hypothetical protein